MFEEKARQRQVAGLRQGADFPVGENSPERGNVAENGKAAQKAAQPMRVADFSVKGTEQPSPAVASVCSVSRILIRVRFITPSALSLWPLRTLVHASPEISQGDHTRHALSREISQGAQERLLVRRCPPMSYVIGGRTTFLSKQSLRTCNVDNELRQALLLLRCPPILADWRTTINTELAP